MALLSEENNSIENDDVRMGGNIFSQPLTLYPNPSNGEAITLNIPQIATDNVQLYLMDSSGRQVWQNRYSVDGSMYQTIVFDQQLAAGLYTLGIMYDGKVEVQRMLVRK
ncbi:MAG: T9SS type A sorting domain-containing protein [Crocinitomicaceae bacterium]|nr:T9SS type A sorting domain-containing protein [Crocinitomicaceae bacterium]